MSNVAHAIRERLLGLQRAAQQRTFWNWTAALLPPLGWLQARKLDHAWLVRQLDAHRRDFDDSADLFFIDESKLGALQRLQRARLLQRAQSAPLPDLRPAWRWKPVVIAWSALALIVAGAWLWSHRPPPALPPLAPVEHAAPAVPGVPQLVAQALRVVPPAYTGLPLRDQKVLDAKAPQGSTLAWRLQIEPQPKSVALQFIDGQTLPLQFKDGTWNAQRVLDKSALYRLHIEGAKDDPTLHRLDAIADAPPQLKVIEPEQALTIVGNDMHGWNLEFEASDDYGVNASAQLKLTLAQGSGENIKFKESVRDVLGSGGAKLKRFSVRIDIAATGMGAGDDLVAQLTVRDNRAPDAQAVQSPGLILRWLPPQEALATGIDGVVQQTLPTYFRSERQVIIDTEALVKAQPKLGNDELLERSNSIGGDQKLLRLRYGQFLGMEDEGHEAPPPKEKAKKPILPTEDANDEEAKQDTQDDAQDDDSAKEAAHPGEDHDHDHSASQPQVFGAAGNVLAEFGHVHDEAEATTLLDPKTRDTLRNAIQHMWQAELMLRQGKPRDALPDEYKALEYIKQVQQADRVYLNKVGTQLPPLDFSRRMNGKREGIAGSGFAPVDRDGKDDNAPANLWKLLQPGLPSNAPDLPAMQAWLHGHENTLDDPLSLLAALETLRAKPDCAECRDALRAALWPALPQAPAQPLRRDAVDAQGQRYLDALKEGK